MSSTIRFWLLVARSRTFLSNCSSWLPIVMVPDNASTMIPESSALRSTWKGISAPIDRLPRGAEPAACFACWSRKYNIEPGNPRMWPWVGPIDAWNVRTGLIRCEQKMARAVIDQLGRRDRNPRHMEYGPMALYHDPPTLVLIRSKPGRTPSPDSQSRSLVLDTSSRNGDSATSANLHKPGKVHGRVLAK